MTLKKRTWRGRRKSGRTKEPKIMKTKKPKQDDFQRLVAKLRERGWSEARLAPWIAAYEEGKPEVTKKP
jgi:hypothetical protein